MSEKNSQIDLEDFIKEKEMEDETIQTYISMEAQRFAYEQGFKAGMKNYHDTITGKILDLNDEQCKEWYVKMTGVIETMTFTHKAKDDGNQEA